MSANPSYSPADEHAKGVLNAIKVMDERVDVSAAFTRDGLGLITLLYGDAHVGVCHILKRRQEEIAQNPALAGQVPRDVVLKLVEVVIYGHGKRAGQKWIFEFGGYRAILASPDGNYMNYWLLSGYKIT